MAHEWDPDRGLTAETAREAIEAQFPALAPVALRFLNEGWDSQAFEANGVWVFRFPKRAEVVPALQREIALLPALGRALPLPVPVPEWIGATSLWFPYPFMGYRKLAGLPAMVSDADPDASPALAAQMAAFLTALHTFPREEALRHGVLENEDTWDLGPGRVWMLERLEAFRDALPPSVLERARARYADASSVPPCGARRDAVIHNDLLDEHILVDEGGRTIAGIIDWGDLSIGDPAGDFVGLFEWGGERLVRKVLEGYGCEADPGFVERARLRAACAGAETLRYGIEAGRAEYVQSSLRGLRNALAG